MYGIEHLLHDCATRCRHLHITEDILSLVLETLWSYVKKQLIAGKSIIIPGLGKFLVQRIKGVETPLFIISDGFTSSYHLKLIRKPVHSNEMPTKEYNPFVISQLCQVKKEIVSSVVVQCVQRLGDVLASGKKVSCDLGGMGLLRGEHRIIEYVPDERFVAAFNKGEIFDSKTSEDNSLSVPLPPSRHGHTSKRSRRRHGVEKQPPELVTSSMPLTSPRVEAISSLSLEVKSATVTEIADNPLTPSLPNPLNSPRRLTILSPTSGTPRNKQNLIFSPRDTDGDSEIEAFLEKLQKKTSHSVIGPPFVTRLEGGRKHGSYGPDTQVTSADLMHAYKQQIGEKKIKKETEFLQTSMELPESNGFVSCAIEVENQKRNEDRAQRSTDDRINEFLADRRSLRLREEAKSIEQKYLAEKDGTALLRFGEYQENSPYAKPSPTQKRAMQDSYRNDLDTSVFKHHLSRSPSKKEMQELRRDHIREDFDALETDLVDKYAAQHHVSPSNLNGSLKPVDFSSSSFDWNTHPETHFLASSLPSSALRNSCGRSMNQKVVEAALEDATRRYEEQMKSREFEEKKFREMEEEQIYANRDHELMLAEKRKKDQEYFRHNLEKQIEERRGRLTGRESSKSIDSDFNLMSVRVPAFPVIESCPRTPRRIVYQKTRKDLEEQIREKQDRELTQRKAELMEELAEMHRASEDIWSEREEIRRRKAEASTLLANAWNKQMEWSNSQRHLDRPRTSNRSRPLGVMSSMGLSSSFSHH